MLNIIEPFKNSERTLYADNYYNSVNIWLALLERGTYFCGTIRANWKKLPKFPTKLLKGEYSINISESGVTIIKFVDKKEVSIITTKQYLDEGNNVGVEKSKSRKIHEKIFSVINDYNKNKYSVDLSDQIGSYHSALRKSNKWHRKLSFYLILNTMINNDDYL